MIYLLELDVELDEAPEPVAYWSRIALKALSTTLTLYFLNECMTLLEVAYENLFCQTEVSIGW